ncbi:hypothetical protein CEP53_003923 [Fusarium sp. AF-6]|nr:hypothetical protein CEP53_003923 [Fusarium sp. AF-6]
MHQSPRSPQFILFDEWQSKDFENLEETRDVFAHAEAFLGSEWMTRFEPFIQDAQTLASSDKAWNMICLNIQMQAWWRKARFGLKCLGYRPSAEDESVVTLQFNWMPRSAMKPTDEMTLQGKDSGFDRMVNSVESFWQGGSIPISAEFGQIKSGVPLISGHLIEIEMPSSDAPLFKAMIDFQWAMIVVAALSGAADDDYSFDTYLRTMEWVEEQKSRNTARHRGLPFQARIPLNPIIRNKKITDTTAEIAKVDGELDEFYKKQHTNASGTLKSRDG